MIIGSGINLVMTVIGFAVSTMFIVFVCTRLICARIQLNASRRSYPTASRSDLSFLERGLHGLEPVVVANFPTKKFSDEDFSADEGAQCTVCLAEYLAKDILRILPYCGHSFHVACIDIWLHQHSTCPVCRVSLRDSSEKRSLMQPIYSSAVRSSLSMASRDAHPYHYFYTSPSYSSRSSSNRRMEPIQEDLFASELDATELREDISSSAGANQVLKENVLLDSGIKQVESPSNCVTLISAVLDMAEFKHLVIVKFKEGVEVEVLLKGMQKLSEVDTVKSFEWGEDVGSNEFLRQGFTHVISITFSNAEDYAAFVGHPSHVEFSATFSPAVEKILVLDFPVTPIKAAAV